MDPLLDPIEGADHREIGGALVDTVRAGNGRIKRAVYPPGFRWSTHMAQNVEPGHDAWVIGDEPAVLIQFDWEEGTTRRLGLPPEHSH